MYHLTAGWLCCCCNTAPLGGCPLPHGQEYTAGESELTPGQTLEMTLKVPENLMPTTDGKLVPVQAAYSDDEQEVALAQEDKQVPHLLCCLLNHSI